MPTDKESKAASAEMVERARTWFFANANLYLRSFGSSSAPVEEVSHEEYAKWQEWVRQDDAETLVATRSIIKWLAAFADQIRQETARECIAISNKWGYASESVILERFGLED